MSIKLLDFVLISNSKKFRFKDNIGHMNNAQKQQKSLE